MAGGIGSGKTALTNLLSNAGFLVIDADVVAREVVEPGKPAWHALVDAFGSAILLPTKHLDRAFLASITFTSPRALRRLNTITHSAIGARLLDLVAQADGQPFAVALPLFRPEHRTVFKLDQVWATECEPEVAVDRLIRYRNFSEEDARARIAAQMSNQDRSDIVDRVLVNNGSLEAFEEQVREALSVHGF